MITAAINLVWNGETKSFRVLTGSGPHEKGPSFHLLPPWCTYCPAKVVINMSVLKAKEGDNRRQLILHSPHLTRFVVPRSRAGLNYIKHGNSYNVSPFGVATNQRHLSKVVRRQHQKNAKMHPTKPPAWSGHRPRSARSLLSAFCHVCPFFMFAVLVVLWR